MSTTVAQELEVRAAQAFLKAIGASWKNTNLIYAVIAWMRQESGSLANIIGNNPFNIRPSKSIDQDLIAGIRRSKNGNGYFIIFKSLEAGLIGTAQLLLRAGHDWRKYDAIIRAFRQGDSIGAINAIALSAWDVSHYGYKPGDQSTNHIYTIYARFTGLQMPATPKPQKPVRRPQPVRPRDLNAPIIVRNYLDPYTVGAMYRARHKRTNILGD